jgi:hypothetical protein
MTATRPRHNHGFEISPFPLSRAAARRTNVAPPKNAVSPDIHQGRESQIHDRTRRDTAAAARRIRSLSGPVFRFVPRSVSFQPVFDSNPSNDQSKGQRQGW